MDPEGLADASRQDVPQLTPPLADLHGILDQFMGPGQADAVLADIQALLHQPDRPEDLALAWLNDATAD